MGQELISKNFGRGLGIKMGRCGRREARVRVSWGAACGKRN
jgi:hypothetical protein